MQGLYQRDDRRLFFFLFFTRDEDVHLPLPRQHVPTREKQHRAPEPEPAEQPVRVHRQRRRCLDYLGRLFAIRKFHAEQDDDVGRSRNGVCTGYHGIALVYAVYHPDNGARCKHGHIRYLDTRLPCSWSYRPLDYLGQKARSSERRSGYPDYRYEYVWGNNNCLLEQ